jgi:ABC-2 type transport system ATP-binding protein
MRRAAPLLGLLLLLAALAPLAMPAPGQDWVVGRSDHRIAMSDGAVIDATLWVPQGTPAGAQLPAIVVIHGYGGSKDVGSARDAAQRGYVGFAYSTRGFGQSTGQMDVVGPRSIQDLKELVAWLKVHGPVAPDKVGVTGCSYGGGHSFQIATHPDAGIATAVPCVGWTDLGLALRPNGAFKFSYTAGFYATGNGLVQSGQQPVDLKVGGQQLGRRQLHDTYAPEVHAGFVSLLAGVGEGNVEHWLRERSAALRVGSLQVPVFIVQGMSDDLFPADQVLPFFHLIPHAEKALYLGHIGHPRAVASGAEVDHVRGLVWAWFDHYLKGVGPKPFDPALPITVASHPWDGTTLRVARLPDGSEGMPLALNADGTLGAPGPAGVGALANTWAAGMPDDAAAATVAPALAEAPCCTALDTLVFRGAPLAEATELLGTARAEVALRTTAGHRFQLAVKVFDHDPATGTSVLVTRNVLAQGDVVPGLPLRVVLDLPPYRHTFPAGHQVEVRLAASDFPAFLPEKAPFALALDLGSGGSVVRLPLRTA